ncbi:MAG: hypothetical protein ACRERD_07365 [Candidatus Binatia bacterium]
MEETSSHIANQQTPDISGVQNPDVTHEHSDVDVRGILMFALMLFAFAVVTLVLVWWMFDYFAVREARSDRPRSLLAGSPGESLPPEPRLQVSPSQDMQTMRAAEDALLNSYGWVDQQAGIVRIPIERAMQLLAERGLPARSAQD